MQPIPKKIKENKPGIGEKQFTTLLVDGSNVLELSSLGDKRLSNDGKHVGGIFQFLLQLKLLLRKGNFRYVYVFWDGENSGFYRYLLNKEYKSNRDKTYEDEVEEGLSEYMKEYNARLKSMERYFRNKNKSRSDDKKKEKDIFYEQRDVVMECLEELFVRQCVADKVEADDFIGYYVINKKPNERIVIASNDRDLTQLISEDVIVYVPSLKKFINTKNHREEMGYDYHNVLLKKMVCGDASDSIKGIKGVGETTLLKNFPQIVEREVSLDEIIEGARMINEERAKEKKKPLKWAENIVNRVTDGIQGERVYEINEKIINLKRPILTDEAKETIDGMMYSPLDPEDRNFDNLYRILLKAGVDDFRDEGNFARFFADFSYLIDKEKKNH